VTFFTLTNQNNVCHIPSFLLILKTTIIPIQKKPLPLHCQNQQVQIKTENKDFIISEFQVPGG
jgi:hypothetical protein